MKRILLLEDDPVITKGLRFTFESEGFALLCCATVAEAEAAALVAVFDAAITDLMLPDGSGETVVRLIKERLPDVPVLVLTAKDDESDAVRLLDAGADDYVVKPFRARELISRVKNLLRRYQKGGVLEAAGLKIDPEAERVWRGSEELRLSALEYRILLLLVQNRGQTVPRERILERIWDLAGNFVNDNTLTVYIKRIREKAGEDVIVTVKGIGYRVN